MTAATSLNWTDNKRYLWLLSPLIPVQMLAALGVYEATGWGALLWWGPVMVYAIIPLLDWLIGEDRVNPPESAVAGLEESPFYRYIVIAYIPAQFAGTIWGTWLACTGGLAVWELVGLIFSVGTVSGLAINTAHELGHKKSRHERLLAAITLAPVAYGHFNVEHPRGHHKNVATPEDPASSKMGESFWRFLPRTVIGSARSGWRIERERLARQGRGPFDVRNEVLQAWSMSVVFFGAMIALFGWAALPFLLLQAAYGASLLEVVNYIEHYGLLRQKTASGRYERCAPAHSWNSNHLVTNLFLYQLQRHSDHHANPTRRFQALRHFENTPQLPAGYAGMLIPAYIPWLWYRMMDHRVVAHYDGDVSRANILPARRAEILRKWQSAPVEKAVAPIPDATPAPGAAPAARHMCTDCGYVYDEAEGCPREGFPTGTRWEDIPDDWSCPDCAVRDKVDFVPADTPRAA